MKLQYLTGTGKFVNEQGDTVTYPIRQIRIVKEDGDFIEAKVDKANGLILPFHFDAIGEPTDGVNTNNQPVKIQEYSLED